MTYTEPARTPIRPFRIRKLRVAGLLAVVATFAAALGYQSPSSSSTSPQATWPIDVPRSERPPAPPQPEISGTANLDPALLGALRLAAGAAAAAGIELHVNSGWRSPEDQERLLREAVSKYGSEEEAARWVATPETSPHVSGHAIDIGPTTGAAWLSAHGATYGLCQIYGNEPWHFELRPEAVVHGCPAMYDDPTDDPRMQR